MNAAHLLTVDSEWSISTSQDGRVGVFRVTHSAQGGYVRGTVEFPGTGGQKSNTEGAIHRLAEAAEDLAFAVMAVEEEYLERSVLTLTDLSTGSLLVLGRDFQALYVDPEITRMAFRLLAVAPEHRG